MTYLFPIRASDKNVMIDLLLQNDYEWTFNRYHESASWEIWFVYKSKLQSYSSWSCVGDVVRWAPDELSFNSAQAYEDIYKPHKPGVVFVKDTKFYVADETYVLCHSILQNMPN